MPGAQVTPLVRSVDLLPLDVTIQAKFAGMIKTFDFARGPDIYYIVLTSEVVGSGLNPFTALQRTNTENWKQIFPEKELRGHSPNFHIHVSVSDLYIPTIRSAYSAAGNMWTDPGNK